MSAKIIVGIDEVGRGPVAGPASVGIVVNCARSDLAQFGARDSKAMTARARERVYEAALKARDEGSINFIVVHTPASEVDQKGIVAAIAGAIAAGLATLQVDPLTTEILLDGSLAAPPEFSQQSFVRGDSLHPIISLASVVAKVERDRLMSGPIHDAYPQYDFAAHKGYGTGAHLARIRTHGPCPEHRRTFLKSVL